MGKVVSHDGFKGPGANQTPGHQDLADLAWEHFKIFVLEDTGYFSKGFLETLVELHEMKAQYTAAKSDDMHQADMEMVLRVAQRQANLTETFTDEIRKMPPDVLSDYADAFFAKVSVSMDTDEIKHSVFSDLLGKAERIYSNNDLTDAVGLSESLLAIAKRLKSLDRLTIEKKVRENLTEDLDVFHDEDVIYSLYSDAVEVLAVN